MITSSTTPPHPISDSCLHQYDNNHSQDGRSQTSVDSLLTIPDMKSFSRQRSLHAFVYGRHFTGDEIGDVFGA